MKVKINNMGTDRVQNNRITFTEEGNAIDSLEKTHLFLTLVKNAPTNWKWVVIALHTTLYGFSICALRGMNHDHVYKNRKCICQKRELITLDEAIRKCTKADIMNGFIGSKPLHLTESQRQSITKIKELRNNFQHYLPKTWIISTDNLPRTSNDILDVVSFLAVDTRTNIHVLKEKQKITKLICDCKKIMETQ